MAESTNQTQELSNLMESWIKTTTSFWKDMGAAQTASTVRPESGPSTGSTEEETDDDNFRTYETWETTVNNLIALTKLLSAPENQDTLSKSSSAFMDAAIQASSDSLENFAEFHTKLIEGFGKVAEHTKAYNLDDLDHSAFESFRDLYRTEIQKYLHVPKVGLPRQYQEQLTEFFDRSNIFFSHLFELMFLFILPFEKTNRKMQKQINKMLEQGEFIDDPKKAYKEWIKMLEANYMHLLNSREYTNVLNNTISSLADYKTIKNDIISFILKDLQVPTNKEMDEVYKDLYHTKKKVKSLNTEIGALHDEIAELKKEMQTLVKEVAQAKEIKENV